MWPNRFMAVDRLCFVSPSVPYCLSLDSEDAEKGLGNLVNDISRFMY